MIRKILLLLVFFVALLPFWMWVGWMLTPGKPLDIVILDKSVPNETREEHRSFNFILTNNKYTTGQKKIYNFRKDYYGYFPLSDGKYKTRDFSNFSSAEISNLADTSDGAYFSETYGVYNNDWYFIRNLIYPPALVYGGLQQKDVHLLRELKARNKLILTEFNLLASPTQHTIRRDVEKLFDIHWTGWTGRYFESLDSTDNPELPDWLTVNYGAQHNGEWPFRKSGIVLIHTSGTLVVLEEKTHLNTEAPMITTLKYGQEKYNVPRTVPYPFWFDLVMTTSRNRIISEYRLDVNPKGEEKLRSYDLPQRFPALIEHDIPPAQRAYSPQYFGWLPSPAIAHTAREYTYYYFAGDFADNPIEPYLARLKGIRFFRRFLYNPTDISDRRRFFWEYYYPMVDLILENYYDEMNIHSN